MKINHIWLKGFAPGIYHAPEGGDGGGSGGSNSGNEGGGSPSAGTGNEGGQQGSQGEGGSGEQGTGGEGGDDNWTPPSKDQWESSQNELNRFKREASEKDRERREALKEKGDHKTLADELTKQNGDLQAEVDTLKIEVASLRQGNLLAGRLDHHGIRSAEIIAPHLKSEDYKDQKSLDKAIEAVLKKFPEFSAKQVRGGAPSGGSNEAPGGTNSDMNASIRAMAGR